MKKIFVAVLTIVLAGCGGDSDEKKTAADSLTRAQKDSIVAELPIPGAGAVGAAMRARDRANERTADQDSVR